jgi:phosphatidylserine/phosphatidylglycerophosphate/cardiolipin synthase-like enzyme
VSAEGVDLYFSPRGDDWQNEIIRLLGEADGSIDFMVFAFTREDIAEAVIAAAARGVTVRGIIDDEFFTSRYDAVTNMVAAGIAIRVAPVHHKGMLIEDADGSTVLVYGSGNFSTAARDDNNEIVLFVHDDADTFSAFSGELDRIWDTAVQRPLEE